MFTSIVTGVDGTDSSVEAARRAAEIAAGAGAILHVVSAYGKYKVERVDQAEAFVFTTQTDAEKVIGETTDLLLGEFPGLVVKGSTAEGGAGEALVRSADALHADLIVIGNKRAQGPARILGSVARDVTARAGCDVYIVLTHRRGEGLGGRASRKIAPDA